MPVYHIGNGNSSNPLHFASVSQDKFKILSLLFHCNIGGKWKILLECLLILHRQKNADVANIWRVGIRVRVTVIHKNRIMCYGVCVCAMI